ncbi:MAG: acetoacetate--CoA ligase [Myxococcaceae bacterium]
MRVWLERIAASFSKAGTSPSKSSSKPSRGVLSRGELLKELQSHIATKSKRKLAAEDVDTAAPLIQSGYLDSISGVAFLAHVARTYQVKIPASQLGGALTTLVAIADHIVEKSGTSKPVTSAPSTGPVVFHSPKVRASEPVYVPSGDAIASSQMTAFTRFVETRIGVSFTDAAAFHAFSAKNFRQFWGLFLEWSGLEVTGSREPVCEGDSIEKAKFFPGLRLNYAANLLRQVSPDDAPAVTSCNEAGSIVRLTRRELRERVLSVAAGLRAQGISSGDRVVAIAKNDANAVVACLATAAVGAVWSSVSPDLGAESILARFEQLEPKVLFASMTYSDHGRTVDVSARVQQVVAGLKTLRLAAVLGDGALSGSDKQPVACTSLQELVTKPGGSLQELELFPFNHPLFILFSSGTTGRPKCIMHGAGGTLIEHCKEHRLHTNLSPSDKLYFHTTCSWMMWNWLLSALAVGTEIVLYEGSVSYPDADALWQLAAREKITAFGTSPAYLQSIAMAGLEPAKICDLSSLRLLMTTGAILPDTAFDWVRSSVGQIPVHSISGGTDIIGCFLLGNPNLPVYAGELQAKSLGLDVRPLGATDNEAIGELVCANPFPSRPLGLYGDATGEAFHATYFSQNPGMWTHGDRFEWTARGSGRIHGRSDGVMNIRGVRIGPAEVYSALADIETIVEGMAVERRDEEESGEGRLLLLLTLAPGVALDAPLATRVRESIIRRCSRAHAPDIIVQVPELPVTHNGKRAERAARDAANGDPVANIDALRNPGAIDGIRAALRADQPRW